MKTSLFILLGIASLSACAQSAAPETGANPKPGAESTLSDLPTAAIVPGSAADHARDALHKINPSIKVDKIEDAPIPGFQQAIVGGQVVYVSNDGKYLMQGPLYDVDKKLDLGEAAMAKMRKDLLKLMPTSDRIVFAPPNPKYTLTVFTDVECAYCRKMHSEIAEYNKQGIAIEYVAFPRQGLGSDDFKEMVAVWCAADPKKALTDSKNGNPVPYKNCRNPVTQQYSLGRRMGLQGTPMVLTSDGVQLGGYVPPAKLRAELDRLAADGTQPAVSTATSG